MQRICVVGAGVIGSLYAAHLASVAEVSVLTRRPEHARALNEHGLCISGKSEIRATVRATASASELPRFDLAIIATKATQLEAAAASLAGSSPEAVVMTIQNGLGAEEIVRRYGPWSLVSAVTFMSGLRHSDTHVEYELDTPTWMGPYAGTQTPLAVVEAIQEMLVASGLKAEAFHDLLPAQWSKLIFNATVNTVAALTELPHVALFARRDTFTDLGHLVHDLIEEGKRVAARVGITLYEDPWAMNLAAVRRGETGGSDYAHSPSMLEDVLARRPTEVDFITGSLVREAERVGEPAPLHTAMYRLIKGREASWASAPSSRPETDASGSNLFDQRSVKP